MSNGLTFVTKFLGLLGFEQKMAFVNFQENRLRIDGEIAENHAILVDHF